MRTPPEEPQVGPRFPRRPDVSFLTGHAEIVQGQIVHPGGPVPLENRILGLELRDLGCQAARSYSLIRPLRTAPSQLLELRRARSSSRIEDVAAMFFRHLSWVLEGAGAVADGVALEHPGALRLRLATGLLYRDSEGQWAAALAAPDPLPCPGSPPR